MNPAWTAFGVADTPARNIYPTASGSTTAVRASAQADDETQGTNDEARTVSPVAAAVAAAPTRGVMGQPLSWWLVLVGLLFGLMYVAGRVGKEGEFGNVKLSAYNVLVISLAAIIGIGFFKVVFARVRVPGLSTYIAAI